MWIWSEKISPNLTVVHCIVHKLEITVHDAVEHFREPRYLLTVSLHTSAADCSGTEILLKHLMLLSIGIAKSITAAVFFSLSTSTMSG